MVADTITEKQEFLEKILKIAEENPEIITKDGRGIFSADCAHVQEKCIVGLHLDNDGKAYFKVDGTYLSIPNPGRIYDPLVLLKVADRYFSDYSEVFKEKFHLDETREGGLDLLDKLRN